MSAAFFMSRIAQILLNVRDTLADPDGQRWSDARLLRLLSEAQQDIVVHTELLKSIVDIPLIIGQATYELPIDCYRLIRASTDSVKLSLTTYTELDANIENYASRTSLAKESIYNSYRDGYRSTDFDLQQYTWEEDTGSQIEAVVYDNINPNQVRFYPIPNDLIADSTYVFENVSIDEFFGDELYGVVTSIESDEVIKYSLDSVFGVVTDLYDPFIDEEVFETVNGIVTQITETTGFVRVWYTQTAPAVSSTIDELIIPTLYDKAIKYYIIAHSFDDDYDTKNSEKSAKSLKLYERELALAARHSRNDGIRHSNKEIKFRGAFDR